MGISYRDHVTNDEVQTRVRYAFEPYGDLTTTVRKRKLRLYGHITRSTGLAKTIIQSLVQDRRKKKADRKRCGKTK